MLLLGCFSFLGLMARIHSFISQAESQEMLTKLGLFLSNFEVYFLGLVAFQEPRKLYCCICIYYISQKIEIDFN